MYVVVVSFYELMLRPEGLSIFCLQVAEISSNQIILAIEGIRKMIKAIIKLFMPSPQTLANMASKQI